MTCAVVKALNSSGASKVIQFSYIRTCTDYEDALNVTSCWDMT